MSSMERGLVIYSIRTALQRRSGKRWSVRGGRGSVYGWIYITARADENLTNSERAELAYLLGLDAVHFQGVRIPAANDYRQEYVDRAEGRVPTVLGEPYWD